MQEKNSGIGEKERIVEIEVERLREFRGHPFKVKPDDQMNMLMESIKKYGILNPLIVRPIPDGAYEIISGNRRRYAAQKLGYRKVPVIIRVLKDEEAVISMVDSNMHREVISPSEKAFACKMKYDAIKRKNGFSSNGQDDYQYKGVQRYLRIADLVPEILEMLDDGKIGFTPAYEASFLTEEEQKNLIQAMAYTQSSPSLSQAQRMKKLSRDGELDLQEMKKILGEVKKGEINRVTFKNEQLHRFFPKEYSAERMKERILDILNRHSSLEIRSQRIKRNKKSRQEDEEMAKVIAIANQKGGCGKTSVAANLGIGLAMAGKKVCLIDADPQGSLTVSLGYPDPDSIPVTLATMMMDIINEEESLSRKGFLHHDEGVDLIPANMELSGIEVSLSNVMSREMILKEFLETIRDSYDYILIDCMPSLGIMTINALVSADKVIIPVQAAYLPIVGLQMLLKTISVVKKRLNKRLSVEGILITMVDYRTNYAKDITAMLQESYGNDVGIMESFIPFSVKVAEASSEGISIFRYAPKCKAAEGFSRLTKEVLKGEEDQTRTEN